MIRGGTVLNARVNSSSLDFDALEEKARLQMKYRVMKRDWEACRIHSKDIIHKQCLEINQLSKEHKKLKDKLRVSQIQLFRKTDSHCVKQVRALLKRRDELDKSMEKERLIQVKLEREIQSIQKKLEEHKQKSHARHIEEVTRTLENKLEHACVRHNKKVVKKRQLKKEVEKLHKDHVQFQQLHRKEDEELQKLNQQIDELITMIKEDHDVRSRVEKKLMKVQEKKEENRFQHITEVNELNTRLAEERHLEFMVTKCSEGTGLEEAQLRRETKKQRLTESQMSVETEVLEDLFQRLQEVTGEEDLEMLVTKFIQGEERKLSLCSYLNEQNTQRDGLKAKIRQMKEEIDRFHEEDLQQDQEHLTTLKQFEEQQRDTEAPTLDYETQAKELTEILGQVKTGVSDLCHKINCDLASMEKLLGCSGGIKDSNLMMYLSLVEQKTKELVDVQKFIKPKDLPQVQASAAQPLVFSDDIDQVPIPHCDEQLLTQEELHQFVGERILNREEEMRAARNKRGQV